MRSLPRDMFCHLPGNNVIRVPRELCCARSVFSEHLRRGERYDHADSILSSRLHRGDSMEDPTALTKNSHTTGVITHSANVFWIHAFLVQLCSRLWTGHV